jgi:hypothetical protein
MKKPRQKINLQHVIKYLSKTLKWANAKDAKGNIIFHNPEGEDKTHIILMSGVKGNKFKHIEYTDDSRYFNFTNLEHFLNFCRSIDIRLGNGIKVDVWTGEDDVGDDDDDDEKKKAGITVYIEGHGEEKFETISEAVGYANEMVSIYVNGKPRKLK